MNWLSLHAINSILEAKLPLFSKVVYAPAEWVWTCTSTCKSSLMWPDPIPGGHVKLLVTGSSQNVNSQNVNSQNIHFPKCQLPKCQLLVWQNTLYSYFITYQTAPQTGSFNHYQAHLTLHGTHGNRKSWWFQNLRTLTHMEKTTIIIATTLNLCWLTQQ